MHNPFKDMKNPFKNVKNPFPHLQGRKLYRSPRDGIVFGICAGVADYLRADPVFVRLVLLVLAFFSNFWPVVLAYAIAAFLMPVDPAQDTVASHQAPKDVTAESRKAGEQEGEKVSEKEEKMDENRNM